MKPSFAVPQSVVVGVAGATGRGGVGEEEEILRSLGEVVEMAVGGHRAEAIASARLVRRLAEASELCDRLVGQKRMSREHWRRSLVADLATALLLSEATVGRLLIEAEVLSESLPLTLAALSVGDVSYRHAQAMVRHARTLPEKSRGEFEATALPMALSATSSQFEGRARTLRERMHPESIQIRHTEAREERGVWVEKECDGMATLVCHLPATDVLAIDDTLDQVARSLRSPEETRTHAQLRADVFSALVLDRSGETAALARGITANLVVTVPALTLLGKSNEPGELLGYGPIDPETARRLAAGAPSFLRILTHPVTGERLSVGREHYKVPADLRNSVILDDVTCRFPGCTRSATRCDLDHTRAWADGGETSLANLAALCRRHHTLKHESAWRVRPGPGRELIWTSPTGREHSTKPPGSLPEPPRPRRQLPDEPPF